MRNATTVIEGVLLVVPTKNEGALIVVPVPKETDVFTAMEAVGHPRLRYANLVIPTAALRQFMVTGRKVVTEDIEIETFNGHGRDGKAFRFTFKIGKKGFPKIIGFNKVEEALIEAE